MKSLRSISTKIIKVLMYAPLSTIATIYFGWIIVSEGLYLKLDVYGVTLIFETAFLALIAAVELSVKKRTGLDLLNPLFYSWIFGGDAYRIRFSKELPHYRLMWYPLIGVAAGLSIIFLHLMYWYEKSLWITFAGASIVVISAFVHYVGYIKRVLYIHRENNLRPKNKETMTKDDQTATA